MMNRRPTSRELRYYDLIPKHAVLQWQIHMHRDDREYQRDVKHRCFLWTRDDGKLEELELHVHDDEIRGFGGSPLPAKIEDMTPALWVEYMHRRYSAVKLDAYRADGWTVDVWTPPVDVQMHLDLGLDGIGA